MVFRFYIKKKDEDVLLPSYGSIFLSFSVSASLAQQ